MVEWVICSGMHDPSLTDQFVQAATAQIPVLSEAQVRHPQLVDLGRPLLTTPPAAAPPVGLLAFSAGVMAAAWHLGHWQQQGGSIAGLIAVDGWGVPLSKRYPTFRLSHDRFTHRSSLPLGSGPLNFYADPSVDHLFLWANPQSIQGWQIDTVNGYKVQATSALAFLRQAVEAIEARSVI